MEDRGVCEFLLLEVTVCCGNHFAVVDCEGLCGGIRRVVVHFEEVCGNLKGLENSLEGKKKPYITFLSTSRLDVVQAKLQNQSHLRILPEWG